MDQAHNTFISFALRLRVSRRLCFAIYTLASLLSLQPNTSAESRRPSTTLISNQAIALNPSNGKIYAVDEAHGAVTIIDTHSHSISSVKVGAGPEALAIHKKTGRVYVANSASGTVSVIDGQNNSVTATVNGGPHPYVLAVNENTNKIYVTNSFSDILMVIDGDTGSTTPLKVGSADSILVDAEANRIFLTGYEDPNLRIINGATYTVEKLPLGMHIWGAAFDKLTGNFYASQTTSSNIVALNLASHEKVAIKTGSIPCAIAANPQSHRLYIANYDDDSVTVVDDIHQTPVAKIKVGRHPQAIAIDAEANRIYVANTHSDTVTVIDGKNNSVIATLNAGRHPFGAALSPDGTKLYVANLAETSFTEISLQPLSPTR